MDLILRPRIVSELSGVLGFVSFFELIAIVVVSGGIRRLLGQYVQGIRAEGVIWGARAGGFSPKNVTPNHIIVFTFTILQVYYTGEMFGIDPVVNQVLLKRVDRLP